MTSSPLVRRGIAVEVETVQVAEFDLLHCGLDDAFIDRAARNLAAVPMSSDDIRQGSVRIRQIDEHDVVFAVSRTDERIVVTIVRIWPVAVRDRMRVLLQVLDIVSIVRGAAGV